MMRLAVKMGCISIILHLALFYYRMNNYERSLRCLQKAENKMSTPDGLYMNKRYLLKKIHSHTMEDVSMTDRMRKCLICDIGIYSECAYIDELVQEQQDSKSNGTGVLPIPPFVILHMLFVLNHQRLGDTVKSKQSVQDLHTLLLYDDGTNVPEHLRDISWHGICQQICGEYVGL